MHAQTQSPVMLCGGSTAWGASPLQVGPPQGREALEDDFLRGADWPCPFLSGAKWAEPRCRIGAGGGHEAARISLQLASWACSISARRVWVERNSPSGPEPCAGWPPAAARLRAALHGWPCRRGAKCGDPLQGGVWSRRSRAVVTKRPPCRQTACYDVRPCQPNSPPDRQWSRAHRGSWGRQQVVAVRIKGVWGGAFGVGERCA